MSPRFKSTRKPMWSSQLQGIRLISKRGDSITPKSWSTAKKKEFRISKSVPKWVITSTASFEVSLKN
jgi:hypothetical protein